MSQNDTHMTHSLTLKQSRSNWPIFHGPVILLYILKSIPYFLIMSQYDQKLDLKII